MSDDNIRDHKFYFHSSKDGNADAWSDDLGGSTEDPAFDRFRYAGYEIALATHVNLDTGECYAYGIVDGNELVEFDRPVRV